MFITHQIKSFLPSRCLKKKKNVRKIKYFKSFGIKIFRKSKTLEIEIIICPGLKFKKLKHKES